MIKLVSILLALVMTGCAVAQAPSIDAWTTATVGDSYEYTLWDKAYGTAGTLVLSFTDFNETSRIMRWTSWIDSPAIPDAEPATLMVDADTGSVTRFESPCVFDDGYSCGSTILFPAYPSLFGFGIMGRGIESDGTIEMERTGERRPFALGVHEDETAQIIGAEPNPLLGIESFGLQCGAFSGRVAIKHGVVADCENSRLRISIQTVAKGTGSTIQLRATGPADDVIPEAVAPSELRRFPSSADERFQFNEAMEALETLDEDFRKYISRHPDSRILDASYGQRGEQETWNISISIGDGTAVYGRVERAPVIDSALFQAIGVGGIAPKSTAVLESGPIASATRFQGSTTRSIPILDAPRVAIESGIQASTESIEVQGRPAYPGGPLAYTAHMPVIRVGEMFSSQAVEVFLELGRISLFHGEDSGELNDSTN